MDPKKIIEDFIRAQGSDLFITVGRPPSMRKHDNFIELDTVNYTEENVNTLMRLLVSEKGIERFKESCEFNTAVNWEGKARLRISMYMQRQSPALAIRRIYTEIPTITELKLPPAYTNLIMEKRGLVLIAGPTGAGKTTSLAAMIDYRNTNGHGHIMTIEDPIEFVHEHKQCIISQRDVGIDTESFEIALRNALRQSPDVLMVGEIRDRETMEQALIYSETGHLVLGTLHANNTYQTIERVLNFFPDDRHRQILLHLSLNLRGVLSQRLVPGIMGKRILAVEIMLNQGLIKELIKEGKVGDIRDQIEKARDMGMQSFEQSLADMALAGLISDEVAFSEADVPANIRLMLKQHDLHKRAHMIKEFSLAPPPPKPRPPR